MRRRWFEHAVPYVRELLLERGRDPEDAARHVESLFAPYWLGEAEDDDPEPEVLVFRHRPSDGALRQQFRLA